MLKVVFAGTPEFAKTALEAILDAGHQVVAVFTQPDRPAGRGMNLQASPVKTLALTHQIPVYQPHSLKINGAYAEEAQVALKALDQIDFDVLVVAAYGLILPQEVFDIAERDGRAGCLNIHASLLPRWRGAAPIHRAIEAGDSVTGISIMQMDLGLDTGAVISMKELAISAQETTATLHDQLAILGGQMLVQALSLFEKDRHLPSQAQDASGATYAQKILKDEARIDWSLSAVSLDRKIRAFNPFPGASFEREGVLFKAWRVSLGNMASPSTHPGTILAIDRQGVHVATGAGSLVLTELQKPGGKRISAVQLAQNLSWVEGSLLA